MMIEFSQMYYLITIVDYGFNLTRSAKVLHVSQPALSKSIKELEFRQDIKIFHHSHGRIEGLTTAGNRLVRDMRVVLKKYEQMMDRLQNSNYKHIGTIRLGIAPVVISTVFSDALVHFLAENEGIHLCLVEKGAYELEKMLENGELDLAILLPPLQSNAINSTLIFEDSVSVWFNEHHRFHNIKGPIPMKEIVKEHVVTLDDSFKVTKELRARFLQYGVQPDFFLQTSSWDLALNMCQNSNLISILATPTGKNYFTGNIEHRDIIPFFPWQISVCTLRDVNRNSLVNFMYDWLINYFIR